MEKKKKQILILGAILLLITILLLIFVIFKKDKTEYISDTVDIQIIDSSDKKILLNLEETYEIPDYLPIYTVSATTPISTVESFVGQTGISFDQEVTSTETGYSWYKEQQRKIFFNIKNNTVEFSLEGNEKFQFTSANSINTFMKEYFNINAEYQLITSQKRYLTEDWDPNSENDTDNNRYVTSYYYNRLIEGYPIITRKYQNYTEAITIKNNYITNGDVFLPTFEKYGEVPLIKEKELDNYLNLDVYPREIQADYSQLQAENLSAFTNYYEIDWGSLDESLTNCTASSMDIVYIYENMNQEYLLPIFRLDMSCELEYESRIYYIPAVAYVNAIDPEYISIPE